MTPDSLFDAAVTSLIDGDAPALRRLLIQYPGLVTARSSSDHRCTLLHYLGANGIEDELQRTPANAVEMAGILLDAGAHVNALAETYGGGRAQTTLCLLVTSVHPARAGVQAHLVRVLVDAGADPEGLDGDGLPLTLALKFGYRDAAEMLVSCGAQAGGLLAAAGMGRLDEVRGYLPTDGRLPAEAWDSRAPGAGPPPPAPILLQQAFALACAHQRFEVATFLLEQGVPIDAMPEGLAANRCTALHSAALSGQTGTVDYLLGRGARRDTREPTFGGTPADWARHGGHDDLARSIEASAAP